MIGEKLNSFNLSTEDLFRNDIEIVLLYRVFSNILYFANNLLFLLQQVTTAYINVLNAVNKSIGLPKYPTLPGLQARQGISDSLPIKQIRDNLNQLQEAASEVGDMMRRVVNHATYETRHTIVSQFRRFTDMWSKHLNEISNMIDNAVHNRQSVGGQANIFGYISTSIQRVTHDIQKFIADMAERVSNQVRPNN